MDDSEFLKPNFDGMREAILSAEIEEANALKEQLDVLADDFQGFDDSYDKEPWIALLGAMKKFEDRVANFSILIFFYGYMARTALNATEIVDACVYAAAGLELCKKHDDLEGVRSHIQILCDIATTMDAYRQAVKFYQLAWPEATAENDDTLKMLTDLAETNEDPGLNFLTDKRPSSFKYFDPELGGEEYTIRVVMRAMGIGRQAALKYKRTADHLREEGALDK